MLDDFQSIRIRFGVVKKLIVFDGALSADSLLKGHIWILPLLNIPSRLILNILNEIFLLIHHLNLTILLLNLALSLNLLDLPRPLSRRRPLLIKFGISVNHALD